MPTPFRQPPFALAALLGVALLAAAAPAAAPPPGGPPVAHPPAAAHAGGDVREQGDAAVPPDGTYVYALSRNGTDQGRTTVAVFRRDRERLLEVDEAGAAGAARVHAIAAYRTDDLSLDSYVATYQAPFLRSSPLGRIARFRPKEGFYDQTTVRYRVDDARAVDTVDGVAGERILRPPGARGPLRGAWVLDAPFMTGALLLPAFQRRSKDDAITALDDAFGDGAVAGDVKFERAAPTSPKTPKSDVVLALPGIASLWFDRGTLVVHEAHFDALNLDARLISYTKAAEPADFEPEPSPSPSPPLHATALTFDSADGTTLAGELDVPAAAKAALPAIVFVPPGPSAGRSFGGDGPSPMYPDLASIFVQRGYAVLRYDTRGVGKSGGSSATETWEQARADALAALAEVRSGNYAVDPKRVYVLGYGNGADLAIAAALQSDAPPAGVVALAPTVTSYRDCDAAAPGDAGGDAPLWIDGKTVEPNDGSWRKSANGHDPAALADRLRLPLFVLHPGVPLCKVTPDQRQSYDEKLNAADPRATIVVANDLSDRFGGRYDADSPANSEALFPYRFDASTAGAIADWLDNPKTAGSVPRLPDTAGAPGAHPAPPPPPALDRNPDANGGIPNPHAATAAPEPRPTQAPAEPGVVLPSGQTPPP